MTIISYPPAISTPFPLSSPFSLQHTFIFPLTSGTTATTTITTKPRSLIRAQSSTFVSPADAPPPAYARNSPDQTLLSLLRQRKTEQAWQLYTQIESTHLPSSTCLSRLVSQLSYQNTQEGLSRAQSIISRLRNDDLLRRLDANSLGLLAVSAARAGNTQYAHAVVKSMLSYNYLPHVKAWSAVTSRLATAGDDGPVEAIKLFTAVTRRVRKVEAAGESRPDTAAFNAVLNACANIGDVGRFLKLFDEMRQWGVEADVLTYNVMIKLCGKVGRKDLIVYVLELLLEKGIEPCVTTFHSLVAAYVGFRDLQTAEKLVQAMRVGRRDVCRILRESSKSVKHNDDSDSEEEDEEEDEYETEYDEVFKQLLPNWGRITGNDSAQAPLLPKGYSPDSRIYSTLMKGYMKTGRVSDTVRTLEAMRHQKDAKSQPDHVSYTTVISAFVKAGSMDRARQVLAEMLRIGVPANLITYNILLKGYCNQLQISKAKELMREMVQARVLPDVVSYNTMIDGCILADDSSGALGYFNEMRARGLAPTKISYTTLMKAFALSGQPGLAQKVFDEMLKDPRVKVDQVAWNMLIEGYCKLGLIESAKKVVENMKEYGCHPNVATYGSLANGIALSRKPGEALLLWNEVKERCKVRIGTNNKDEEGSGEVESNSSSPSAPPPPIIPDEGLLETLADICVRAAFFRKALEIVACMEEHGIAPNKRKYSRIYVEMHSKMFTSKHASKARQDRRRERKRAAEAFKFWLGLPNSYYDTEWTL